MFKAKLIDNESYYKLRGKHFLLMLLPTAPIGIVANFYELPIWATVGAITLYVLSIIILAKNQRLMQTMLGNKLIHLDSDAVSVYSKKGILNERIELNGVEKISVKSDYSLAQEKFSDISKEIKGDPKMNYLIIHNQGESRPFHFEIDSYYMLKQLEKLIGVWKSAGYSIEKI